jgi:hypothetical protein
LSFLNTGKRLYQIQKTTKPKNKGLSLTKFLGRFKKNHIKICGSFVYKAEAKKSEQLKNQ